MQKLLKIVLYVLMALFIIISIGTIIKDFNIIYSIFIILGTLLFIPLLKVIKNKINNLDRKKCNIISYILIFIFFILLIIFGMNLTSHPVTDLSNIISYVNNMIKNNSLVISGTYFSRYPSQIPLLIIIYYIYKLASIINISGTTLAIIVNALSISITSLFVYKIVNKISNSNNALFSLILMIINPIFYMYSSYYYTDTLCMPFSVIGFYLIINNIDKQNIKKYLLLILSGFIFYIGFKIRVVSIILLIGEIIYLVVSKHNNLIKIVLSIFIGIIIGLFASNLIENTFVIELDEDEEFPLTHWVMMGLNEEYIGGYNSGDYNITANSLNKIEENSTEIKNRIEDFGIINLTKFEIIKLCRVWSDGTYGVMAKLTNTNNVNLLYNLFGGYGKYNSIVKIYLQIIKLVLNISIILGIYYSIKNKHNFKSIYISLFGAVLFYILWEAAARYSLAFLPWMIIPIGSVFDNLNIKIKSNKIINIVTYTFTILILLLGCYLLCIKNQAYEDVVISSYRGFTKFKIEDGDTIKEVFKANSTFNQIEIKFKNSNISEKSSYIFILYNEKEVVYEEIFYSNVIENDSYYIFSFSNMNEGNYTMEISKIEGESTLSIITYKQTDYQLLDGINTYINNEITDDTIVFNVIYKNERSYLNIFLYSIISIFIIGTIYVIKKEDKILSSS